MTIFTFALVLFLPVLLGVGVLMLVRMLLGARRMPAAGSAPPVAIEGLDAAAHLAEVIQCQTVSRDSTSAPDAAAFRELQEVLLKNYPLVHTKLKREVINDLTLLYTWQGTEASLQPVLLAAHQDVVPVDPRSLEQWEYPPFSGAIANGFIWGRGSLDIKCQMIAILEGVEHLLQQGFQPQRTVCVAFGHDEEIGGAKGAAVVAALLKERGIRLASVIDEGGGVMRDMLPGVETPIALVGVAEKGSLTLELSVETSPGHSSVPPAHTSIGILASALTRLEASPMPASLRNALPLFRAVSPHLPFGMRLVFANLWFFGGFVRRNLEKNPQSNAMLRTTTAITMVEGGIKTNILPPRAAAMVNYRLAPGDSVEDVIAHTRGVVADERVVLKQPFGAGREASGISPHTSQAFRVLETTIRQIFEDVPVAPFLVMGGTDARHYAQVCDHVWRFSPLRSGKDDFGRVHGIGERISIENLETMVKFFIHLLRVWDAEAL